MTFFHIWTTTWNSPAQCCIYIGLYGIFVMVADGCQSCMDGAINLFFLLLLISWIRLKKRNKCRMNKGEKNEQNWRLFGDLCAIFLVLWSWKNNRLCLRSLYLTVVMNLTHTTSVIGTHITLHKLYVAMAKAHIFLYLDAARFLSSFSHSSKYWIWTSIGISNKTIRHSICH